MQQTEEHAIGGRRPTDAPFPNWLRAQGKTLTEWCEKHDVDRQRVKGWYAKGAGARQCPREWANLIQREAGKDPVTKRWVLPADESTWPNGIKG